MRTPKRQIVLRRETYETGRKKARGKSQADAKSTDELEKENRHEGIQTARQREVDRERELD